MQKMICGVAMALLMATGAEAGARENALKHIASVIAIANMCPGLEMNGVLVAAVGLGNGVDPKRDADEIKAEALLQSLPWRGKEKDACVAGIFLYGPNGANVPKLLSIK